MFGIPLDAAFGVIIAWARWQAWLHPIAALRAHLRERGTPAREAVPA